MTETEFLNLIEKTLFDIEEAIDQSGLDIDYERGPGMLTLTFPDQTVMVLNRQTPLKQLWLANKKQGYHFDFVNNEWFCEKTNESLQKVFNDTCHEHVAQGKNVLLSH